MELEFKDENACECCKDQHPRVVKLVHQYLGPASAASVKTGFRGNLYIETATHSMIVSSDLTIVRTAGVLGEGFSGVPLFSTDRY